MTVTPVAPPAPASARRTASPLEGARWTDVCAYADLLPERGVCALVGGEQVAVFRTFDGALHAVSNRDPFSGAQVLSRGILGTRDGRPTVASPMFKQVFDLATGECPDEPGTAVQTRPIRLRGDRVEVGSADGDRE